MKNVSRLFFFFAIFLFENVAATTIPIYMVIVIVIRTKREKKQCQIHLTGRLPLLHYYSVSNVINVFSR